MNNAGEEGLVEVTSAWGPWNCPVPMRPAADSSDMEDDGRELLFQMAASGWSSSQIIRYFHQFCNGQGAGQETVREVEARAAAEHAYDAAKARVGEAADGEQGGGTRLRPDVEECIPDGGVPDWNMGGGWDG